MRRPTSCCFRILPTHAWGARALKMPSFGGAASSCFSRTLSSNEWGARVLTLPQVFPDFEEGGVAYDLPVGTQVPEEGELFEIFTDKIMVPYENLLDEPVVVAKYLVDEDAVVKVGEPVAIVIPNVDDLPAFQAADTEGRIVIEYAEGEVPRMVVTKRSRYYSPQWGPMVVTKSPLVAKLREDQGAYIAKYGPRPTTAK